MVSNFRKLMKQKPCFLRNQLLIGQKETIVTGFFSNKIFLQNMANPILNCMICRCRVEFGVFTRKHHCRACGQIFCDRCSNKQMLLPQFGIEKKVRVCEACFDKKEAELLAKVFFYYIRKLIVVIKRMNLNTVSL